MNCKEIIYSLSYLTSRKKNSLSFCGGSGHLRYLIEYRRSKTSTTLLTSGRLHTYLAEIDKQAQERMKGLQSK